MRRSWVILLVLFAMLLPKAVYAQDGAGSFEQTACSFENQGSLVDGQDIECGFLIVPEQYAEPDGPTIRLAVAIIKSNGTNPAAEPLFFLQGGPGGSTIDTYLQYIALERLDVLREAHDLVLFDQRGTLNSEPVLSCPEEWKLTEETLEQELSDDEERRLGLEAGLACRERLVSEGINLSAYDSVENAADVETLRVALGYDKINLYGVSYGTLLALHVMRNHPDGLRSVILDSVVPAQTNFIPEVPRSEARAFNQLFDACAADADCNAAYPNLEQVFFELFQALNAQPARVPMTDPESKRTYQVVFDGDMLESMLFQLLYATEIIPVLPAAIYQMRDGNFSFAAQIMPLILFDQTISSGMYYSVICAEDADYTVRDVHITDLRPEIADTAVRDAQYILELCQSWDVELLDAQVDEPVRSDIPTLVLNGRFDPITPPAFGESAAETLSNSYVYTFGNTGHGALTTGECPLEIVSTFLAEPEREPDADCIDEQPAPAFLSPENTAFSPFTGRLVTMITNGDVLGLIVMALCLLWLLTLFLVWPVGFLIRVASGRPVAHPGPTTARWIGALTALLALVFVVGMIIVVFQTALTNEMMLFVGIPASAGALLMLPWIIGGLALLMVACTAFVWMRRSWSVWGRVYYTLLTLGAIGFVGMLVPLVG